jgi:hypothetical protein
MEKQMATLKDDQAEYKGITKRYTDQLVKVKVRCVVTFCMSSRLPISLDV